MMSRSALAAALTLSAMFAACGGSGTESVPKEAAPDNAAVKETEQFRAKHEADYRKEYVSLAGLFFLNPGANKAGSAPGDPILLPSRAPASIGTFVLKDADVRFNPAPGASVT